MIKFRQYDSSGPSTTAVSDNSSKRRDTDDNVFYSVFSSCNDMQLNTICLQKTCNLYKL